MKPTRSRVSHLRRHGGETSQRERGQIILMVGLATVVMFGIVGLAVDVGRLYVARVELGRALDAAALSGILELNGTGAGETAAAAEATEYFQDNEPGITPSVVICTGQLADGCDGDNNTIIMDATKQIDMIFLSVLGIKNAGVSAHAKAGFGTQYLDVAMVLDATPSMAGNPITQAKAAATTFKNILLGNNPQGNVVVGVTAFRGCFKANAAATTPAANCIPLATWSTNLTSNHTTLNSVITAIQGESGGNSTATNVCTGLAQGWKIISGTGNHNNDITYPGNKQYMVLLSDGDNAYWGSNTYVDPLGDDNPPANSSSSPQGAVVGANEFPCQPYDSCSSPWNTTPTQPCVENPNLYTTGVTVITDGFESNNWTGGSGWAGDWTPSGSPSIITGGSPSPQEGSRHTRLRSSDMITRQLNLSGLTSIDLKYFERTNNLEDGDEIRVRASTNGTSWTTLETISGNHGYQEHTVGLDSYAGQATVYIRFDGDMSSIDDQFYVDNIRITTDSQNGFLNGNDGSNPGTCNENPRPRERQIDARTIKLAQAIKAQGIEIFVVAFSGGVSGCNLNNTTVYNDENAADCNAVNQSTGPVISGFGTINGPIGDNTHDGTANHRILKCIASNTQGTLDHYFFANDEDELTGIFTKIANQIAHRLIE